MTETRIRITASDETGAAFDSATRKLTSMSKTAVAAGAAVAALGAAGFVGLVKPVADAGDQLQKLSIRLGASTEALSQYRLVADRTGVSFESLTTAWQKLSIRAAEAAQDSGPAVEAFRELGIEADKFAKLRPEQQFEVLADAMEGVADAGRRQYLAQKLMEKGGVQLLQAMEGGSAAIRQVRDEADRMGLTFTRVQADQMAAFNDSLTDAKYAIQGAAQALVVSFGPAIVDVARAIAVGSSELAKFIDGFRDLENRSNIDGLRERLTDLNTAAYGLGMQIEYITKAGGDTTFLERRYQQYRDEISATIARLRDLQSEESKASGGGAVEDFQFTPGVMPSASGSSTDGDAAAKAAEAAAREQERLREQFAQRLEVVREYAASESELLTQNYLDRVFVIEEAVQNELIAQEDANRIKLELEQRYQADLTKITEKGLTDRQKFERMDRASQARELSSHLMNMLADVGQHNRAMFNIYKAAAIAQAIIGAHEGAARTMGAYPYPVNVALAALSYAAGIARVAAIASTSFGATSSNNAGGVGGGTVGTYPVDPVIGLPETQQTPVPTVQEVTVNLGDQALFDAASVRALIEAINEQTADGVLIGGIKVA